MIQFDVEPGQPASPVSRPRNGNCSASVQNRNLGHNRMNKLTIITGDNHNLVNDYVWKEFPKTVIIPFPESRHSNPELRYFTEHLIRDTYEEQSHVVTTLNLFLFREIYLQLKDWKDVFEVEWVNVKADGVQKADNEAQIGNLVILDSELEQSDRYMDVENGIK